MTEESALLPQPDPRTVLAELRLSFYSPRERVNWKSLFTDRGLQLDVDEDGDEVATFAFLSMAPKEEKYLVISVHNCTHGKDEKDETHWIIEIRFPPETDPPEQIVDDTKKVEGAKRFIEYFWSRLSGLGKSDVSTRALVLCGTDHWERRVAGYALPRSHSHSTPTPSPRELFIDPIQFSWRVEGHDNIRSFSAYMPKGADAFLLDLKSNYEVEWAQETLSSLCEKVCLMGTLLLEERQGDE